MWGLLATLFQGDKSSQVGVRSMCVYFNAIPAAVWSHHISLAAVSVDTANHHYSSYTMNTNRIVVLF